MATVQDVLNVARSLIGVHETPDGSNIAHPITDWASMYGYSTGDAWCSWTVSYEFFHAFGGAELIYNHPDGYSGYFRSIGQKYGLMIPGPKPGAIDVMDFDGKPDFTDHVGIVESVNADGSWVNIEGNHQNRVMRVTRAPGGGSHWFILPKYSSTTTPIKDEQEDEQMLMVEHGDPRWFSAGLPVNKPTYFDLTSQTKDSVVQLFFKRDNGDMPSSDENTLAKWRVTIKQGTSYRFDACEKFNVHNGGFNVNVDVKDGGPVLVTRMQKTQ